MFPKSSLVMVLVAGLLLLAACLIDKFNNTPVNEIYLALGIVLIIFSSGLLIFRKR